MIAEINDVGWMVFGNVSRPVRPVPQRILTQHRLVNLSVSKTSAPYKGQPSLKRCNFKYHL
jgi:hypothetical protein